MKRYLDDGSSFFDKVHGFSHISDVLLFVQHKTQTEKLKIDLYDDENDKLIATFYP